MLTYDEAELQGSPIYWVNRDGARVGVIRQQNDGRWYYAPRKATTAAPRALHPTVEAVKASLEL